MSYLYRVVVLAYPEGAMLPCDYDPDESYVNTEWAPAGWTPTGNYAEILGTTDFIWPVTNKTYRARSSAMKRKKLIESYGATAIVQRSSRIDWPADGETTVAEPDKLPSRHFFSTEQFRVETVVTPL